MNNKTLDAIKMYFALSYTSAQSLNFQFPKVL